MALALIVSWSKNSRSRAQYNIVIVRILGRPMSGRESWSWSSCIVSWHVPEVVPSKHWCRCVQGSVMCAIPLGRRMWDAHSMRCCSRFLSELCNSYIHLHVNCEGTIRVCQITKMCSNLYSKYLMWWPIYLRTLGQFLFLPKNIVDGPSKGGQTPKSLISKFSELYDVGTLNLCLKTPGIMKKKSAQSDHHVLRKRPKCA